MAHLPFFNSTLLVAIHLHLLKWKHVIFLIIIWYISFGSIVSSLAGLWWVCMAEGQTPNAKTLPIHAHVYWDYLLKTEYVVCFVGMLCMFWMYSMFCVYLSADSSWAIKFPVLPSTSTFVCWDIVLVAQTPQHLPVAVVNRSFAVVPMVLWSIIGPCVWFWWVSIEVKGRMKTDDRSR